MDLKDLFQQLSYGELSNLSMSFNGSGTLTDIAKPKIVGYANEALVRLYSRFVLKENDVLVKMLPGVTYYHLLKQYAQQSYDPTDPDIVPYIMDLSREKFEEDVIRILSIYDSKNCKRPLNDDNAWNSIFTPQHQTIQNPLAYDGEVLSIHYQAKHKKLYWDGVITSPVAGTDGAGGNEQPVGTVPAETLAQQILLPDVLMEAFTAYIAHRVYSSMNNDENNVKSQEHFINYKNICDEVMENDLVSNSTAPSNIKFRTRGFP